MAPVINGMGVGRRWRGGGGRLLWGLSNLICHIQIQNFEIASLRIKPGRPELNYLSVKPLHKQLVLLFFMNGGSFKIAYLVKVQTQMLMMSSFLQ